jgi:hypothetical protein
MSSIDILKKNLEQRKVMYVFFLIVAPDGGIDSTQIEAISAEE